MHSKELIKALYGLYEELHNMAQIAKDTPDDEDILF